MDILSAILSLPFLIFSNLAFAEPTQAPPLGNAYAPINVGSSSQIKNGGLGLNALSVFGGSYFKDSVSIGTDTPAANTLLTVVGSGNDNALAVEAPNITSNVAFMVQNIPLSTSLATGKAFGFSATGESFARGMFYSDGKFGIGSGSATRDIFISRDSANVLKVSSDGEDGAANLIVTGDINLTGDIYQNGSIFSLDDLSDASTTGTANLFLGEGSGNSNTTGFYNTANGNNSLFSNTTGNRNTADGYDSLYSNTTGSYNSAQGVNALYSNTTGLQNSAQGMDALYSNTTGSNNSAQGTYALNKNTTGSNNSAQGSYALYYNTTGYQNTANGYQSLYYNTTGSNNSAQGTYALNKNTTGSYNSAQGLYALHSNTTGSANSAQGGNALRSNTTGYQNTANGTESLYSNTTGYQNNAQGYDTLYYNTTGYRNTANGHKSLYFNTTGYQNTASGLEAGSHLSNGISPNETTYASVYTGAYTKASADGVNNENVFGYGAIGAGSNTVRLGNTSITGIYGQVAMSATSDERLKKDITPLTLGLDFISKLNPVSYIRKNNEDNTKEWGLIAQDVKEILKETGNEDSGMVQGEEGENSYLSLRYNDLIAPLIKSVQELEKENNELKDIIGNLEERLEKLENK